LDVSENVLTRRVESSTIVGSSPPEKHWISLGEVFDLGLSYSMVSVSTVLEK